MRDIFEGTTIRDAAGRPVGCRLVDSDGLLADIVGTATLAWEVVAQGPDAGIRLEHGTDDLDFEAMFLPQPFMDTFLACAGRLETLADEDPVDDVTARLSAAAAAARDGIAPFLDTLDPMAREACLGMSSVDWATYAALDSTVDPLAPLAMARERIPHLAGVAKVLLHTMPDALRAAAAQGPVAVEALVMDEVMSFTQLPAFPDRLRDVLAAMDAMGPGELAEFGAAVDAADMRRAAPAVAVADLLATMPPEWVPGTSGEWLDLAACAPAAAFALRLGGADGLAGMIGRGPGWRACRGRLRRRGRPHLSPTGTPPGGPAADDARGLHDALRNAGHMSRAFVRQVARPALALSGLDGEHLLDQDGFRLMGGARTVSRILEESHEWHSHLHEAYLAMPAGGEFPDRWAPGYPDAAYGDVEVRVLVDVGSLRAEGDTGPDPHGVDGLSHCVGSYGGDCLAGRIRILSLRRRHPDGGYERLATAEVEPPVPGHMPHVREMRGRCNSFPPTNAMSAMVRYAGDVQHGLVGVDMRAFEPVAIPPALRDAGYDWRLPGNWERVRDAWARHLPRALRGLDAAGMAGHCLGLFPDRCAPLDAEIY